MRQQRPVCRRSLLHGVVLSFVIAGAGAIIGRSMAPSVTLQEHFFDTVQVRMIESIEELKPYQIEGKRITRAFLGEDGTALIQYRERKKE